MWPRVPSVRSSESLLLLALAAVLLAAGCMRDGSSGHAASHADVESTTIALLESALDTLRMHSVYRDSVDWGIVRREATDSVRGATGPNVVHDAIENILRRIGDRHSFLMSRSVAADWARQRVNNAVAPELSILSGKIGLVRMPAVPVTDSDSASAYATRLHAGIRRIDAADPCGWILDLRSNTGGNMWAMLASVGPLLVEGAIGSFAFPDGRIIEWSYSDGKARMGDSTLVEVERPYRLRADAPPVALLVGTRTASSGEAVVIAFQGQSTARSFGEPTAGVPSANRMFVLPDSSAIALATAWFADRSDRVYRQSLVPDSLVSPTSPGTPVETAGMNWLLGQPSCGTTPD